MKTFLLLLSLTTMVFATSTESAISSSKGHALKIAFSKANLHCSQKAGKMTLISKECIYHDDALSNKYECIVIFECVKY